MIELNVFPVATDVFGANYAGQFNSQPNYVSNIKYVTAYFKATHSMLPKSCFFYKKW